VQCRTGSAKSEGTTFGVSCDDWQDNDCDGAADLADSDCAGSARPSLCGTASDDGRRHLIDKASRPWGCPAPAGAGACTGFGVYVCKGDGTGTSAAPWRARRPRRATGAADCADVIDNDCDGLVDAADPDCARRLRGSRRLLLAALPARAARSDAPATTSSRSVPATASSRPS